MGGGGLGDPKAPSGGRAALTTSAGALGGRSNTALRPRPPRWQSQDQRPGAPRTQALGCSVVPSLLPKDDDGEKARVR